MNLQAGPEAKTYYRISERLLYEDGRMAVDLEVYLVVRRTAKGAWIRLRTGGWVGHGRDRFVLDGSGKRFAYPTVEEAVDSYRIRKRRQIGHLEVQLVKARAALKFAELPDFKPGQTYQDDALLIFHEY